MIITDKKTGEQLDIRINAQRKSAIKKIFAQAKNIKRGYATLSEIKKAYPKLNFSKAISWLTVLADSLEVIEKLEILLDASQPAVIDTKTVRMDKKEEVDYAVNKYGVTTSKFDYLTGVSTKIYYNRNYLADLSWNVIRNSWIVSFGRSSVMLKVESADHGIAYILQRHGFSLAQVMGLETA